MAVRSTSSDTWSATSKPPGARDVLANLEEFPETLEGLSQTFDRWRPDSGVNRRAWFPVS